MDVEFQSATANDKAYFWSLYVKAMRPYIDKIWGWDTTWQEQDFEKRWLDSTNLIIHTEGRPAGFIQTQDHIEFTYVIMFILDTTFRNKGLGASALKLLSEKSVTKPIQLRVFKINRSAFNFYINHGFEVLDLEESFYVLQKKVTSWTT
ncbi:GNAT family N-acetyltransferase [Aestuariibacter salexigens]|uniref:GNAT family N-acetyltransferase n=1 Tax=Aestuariibacter salexigens TaxID=226010 RepID=UPI000478FB5B|nr:GNAT family N-acetyltransferase [Aestuariibacter salexigens]